VTPLSLGVETAGGIMTTLVEKGTTIPVKKSMIFSTAVDNQPAVTVRIAQGESELFEKNKLLGNFDLQGIPPAPRGVPQIEVCFDIDADGILHVTATDKATGKSQSLTVQPSSGLTEEEINKIIEEAKKHEEEDRKFQETVELRNQLDALVYSLEKTVKENEAKLTAEDKKEAEEAIKEAKDAIASNERDKIQAAIDKVTSVANKIAQKLYQSGEGAGAGAQQQKGNDDDTIEPEVH